MNQRLLTEVQKTQILNILNETAEAPVWQKSNFLRSMGKRFASIRDNFKASISIAKPVTAPTTASQNTQTKTTCVYIAVYSIRGNDTDTWEKILANLPNQLPSRPIYAQAHEVISLIKSKSKPENEAYIAVSVPNNNICQVDPKTAPKDKLGQPKLTLMGYPLERHFTADFYHISGKYQYKNGKLTKLSENESL